MPFHSHLIRPDSEFRRIIFWISIRHIWLYLVSLFSSHFDHTWFRLLSYHVCFVDSPPFIPRIVTTIRRAYFESRCDSLHLLISHFCTPLMTSRFFLMHFVLISHFCTPLMTSRFFLMHQQWCPNLWYSFASRVSYLLSHFFISLVSFLNRLALFWFAEFYFSSSHFNLLCFMWVSTWFVTFHYDSDGLWFF